MTAPVEDTDAVFQRVLLLFNSPEACNIRVLSAGGVAAWQAAGGPKDAWHPFFFLRLCCILTRDRCNGSFLQTCIFSGVSSTEKATKCYFCENKPLREKMLCARLSLWPAGKLLVEAVLKHIPNVQTHFDCPQTLLSSYLPRRLSLCLHCRMDIFWIKQTFWDWELQLMFTHTDVNLVIVAA